MQWLVIVALILIGLTWMYTHAMRSTLRPWGEGFLDFIDRRSGVTAGGGPDGVEPEIAAINTGVLLESAMTPAPGLSGLTAGACYAQDRTNELQLGGQYAQRTNNYRRDYPDNCSAPLTDFVDSMYAPRDGVGLTVPCAGQCN